MSLKPLRSLSPTSAPLQALDLTPTRDDRDTSPRASAKLVVVKPTWRGDLVLVCKKCEKKRHPGIDGKPVSKWLKSELKARGEGKRFRLVSVGCLDLCPKRGVVLARGQELGEPRPLRVLRADDDPQAVLDWLLKPQRAAVLASAGDRED